MFCSVQHTTASGMLKTMSQSFIGSLVWFQLQVFWCTNISMVVQLLLNSSCHHKHAEHPTVPHCHRSCYIRTAWFVTSHSLLCFAFCLLSKPCSMCSSILCPLSTCRRRKTLQPSCSCGKQGATLIAYQELVSGMLNSCLKSRVEVVAMSWIARAPSYHLAAKHGQKWCYRRCNGSHNLCAVMLLRMSPSTKHP